LETGSELLDSARQAPLSIALVARPTRACVLVPNVEGVPWAATVEHALAAQTGVWGGTGNLVIPTGWELADDEIFWRIIDLFDPDLVALHTFTYSDVREVAPEQYAAQLERDDRALRDQGFGDAQREEALRRREDETAWAIDVSDPLAGLMIDRVAPLHHERDLHVTVIDGRSAPGSPFTDVAQLHELPPRVSWPTAEDPLLRLLLTHAYGRVLPSLRGRLAIEMEEEQLQSDAQVALMTWPRRLDTPPPTQLSGVGLMRRIAIIEGGPVVVVGDEPRDFLLFHGLSRLRPSVYWLPASRLDSDVFVRTLHGAVSFDSSFELRHDRAGITSASNEEAAAELARQWPDLDRGRRAREAVVIDWREALPQRATALADGSSERRISLVVHEGETAELPAVYPLSVSTHDPLALNWMIDVEVAGWTPIRHPQIGAAVLGGAWMSTHDARASVIGPSYQAHAGFVMAGVALEATVARTTLRPRDLIAQLQAALPDGWEIALSDKGAYALESARTFGGVEGLVAALRDPATRRVLDAFARDERDAGVGLFLKDTRRWYLSFEEITALAGDDAPAVLASLTDREALVRGHALKCEHCRATSFYSLDEHQRFTCVRCRRNQRATRFSWLGEPEPKFRYALAAVVYQFLRHNGHVPLLAAYDRFATQRRNDRRSFDVAFEVDIKPPDSDFREHDIVASWGAELWIGEATTEATLADSSAAEQERLTRLSDVAAQLSARGVLLVTTSERFSDRTRGNVENAFRDQWATVRYVEGFDAGPTQRE
jgi:hypothetical protein